MASIDSSNSSMRRCDTASSVIISELPSRLVPDSGDASRGVARNGGHATQAARLSQCGNRPPWIGCREFPAGRRACNAEPPEEPAPAEEFDHEIANIYCEEATELLEAAEVSLTAWNHDRKDKQRVAELQRQLHTLKGGARMAGIGAMGDLSHELETLVIQIDVGHVAADDAAMAVMQASLDELARMRDLVSAALCRCSATALIAQIARSGESGASAAPAPPLLNRAPRGRIDCRCGAAQRADSAGAAPPIPPHRWPDSRGRPPACAGVDDGGRSGDGDRPRPAEPSMRAAPLRRRS